MNLIKGVLLTSILIASTHAFARVGGDDIGNGGWAIRQSIIILKMATEALDSKIQESTLADLEQFPERRRILTETLSYDELDKISKKDKYRAGKKLAMDYTKNPPSVAVYKSYFEAFAGKTDTELEDASLEVQKRLLHEAAHIWGYKEDVAEDFAKRFLANVDQNETRPTKDITILDFASCINGKAETMGSDEVCARKPQSDQPILYVSTKMGPLTLGNPKLGTLEKWCGVQLANDTATPQCTLNATDGINTYNLALAKISGNSFSVNISSLARKRTWLLKLVESKTGSDAETQEFQIIRMNPPADPDEGQVGALKVTPVNQYTCINYGIITNNGMSSRDSFVRTYYNFSSNETPAPLPPLSGTSPAQIVCHDEILHPGNDSIEYPRLELVPGVFSLWDKSDMRFIARSENFGKLTINKILETRLLDEYNVQANLDLFKPLISANRPMSGVAMAMGYIMVPFRNSTTGKAYCPTSSDYQGTQPLLNLLGDYMDDTEGLYITEKEAEVIQVGTEYKTMYGTMLTRESILKNYGFYVENGLKIRVDSNTMHTKTVNLYWPISTTVDALTQGTRKLFTVRTFDTLSGNSGTTQPSTEPTSDKRIGCIPKAWN